MVLVQPSIPVSQAKLQVVSVLTVNVNLLTLEPKRPIVNCKKYSCHNFVDRCQSRCVSWHFRHIFTVRKNDSLTLCYYQGFRLLLTGLCNKKMIVVLNESESDRLQQQHFQLYDLTAPHTQSNARCHPIRHTRQYFSECTVIVNSMQLQHKG